MRAAGYRSMHVPPLIRQCMEPKQCTAGKSWSQVLAFWRDENSIAQREGNAQKNPHVITSDISICFAFSDCINLAIAIPAKATKSIKSAPIDLTAIDNKIILNVK